MHAAGRREKSREQREREGPRVNQKQIHVRPAVKEETEPYPVKKILNKRINESGEAEYEVEWEKTWEPASSINSLELITAFENRLAIADSKFGPERELEPDKIIAASDTPGHLHFLVSWRGSRHADLIPAEEAYQLCPDLVLSFYEKNVHFQSIDDPTKLVPMRRLERDYMHVESTANVSNPKPRM